MTSEEIKKQFGEISDYKSKPQKWDIEGKLLIAQFISHIISVMEDRGIKRKDLAKMIGKTSPFITQLFRGNKRINFTTLAKIQDALDIKFDVRLESMEQQNINWVPSPPIDSVNDFWIFHRITGEPNAYKSNECLGNTSDIIDKSKEVEVG